jgi:hypothetical protein
MLGKLLKHLFNCHKIEVGDLTSIWNKDPKQCEDLLTKSWIKTTLMDVAKVNIRIEEPLDYKQTRQEATYIMDLYLAEGRKMAQMKRYFNWCRMYCKVTELRDIAMADGLRLHPRMWHRQERRDDRSAYTWPHLEPQTTDALRIWQRFLQNQILFSRQLEKGKLKTPIPVEEMKQLKWTAGYTMDKKQLLIQGGNDWYVANPYLRQGRTPRFRKIEEVANLDKIPITFHNVDDEYYVIYTVNYVWDIKEEDMTKNDYKWPCTYIKDRLIENLETVETTRKWSIQDVRIYGSETVIINALCDGTLRVVTDGLYKDNNAMAAIKMIADKNNILFSLVVALGPESSFQSHRAELSGHYSIITILEVVEQMLQKEGVREGGCIVACDNQASLQIYNTGYVFTPSQKDYDIL